MLAINARQYLSVITTTGADIHVSVTYRDSGLGRGHTRTDCTAITTAVATPGTSVLAGPDTPAASKEVAAIHIRNIDSTSQTVTVGIVRTTDSASGTTDTFFQLYSEVIAAGQELVYEEGAGWTLATHNTIGVWNDYIMPADVLNTANDVLADVTGLSATVTAGYVYEFHAFIAYTADATTTGSRWTVNGPAATWLAYDSRYSLTATSETVNHATAYQIPAAANATSATTTGNMAEIHGFVKPSANGTLAIQNAAENTGAANDITALAGSTLRIRRVL
jgi:hypothetical protein